MSPALRANLGKRAAVTSGLLGALSVLGTLCFLLPDFLVTRDALPLYTAHLGLFRAILWAAILAFATGTQLFVEPQLVNQASLGLVPNTWSSNQLAYQMAFRYGDFNAAAAISVDLIAIGLIAAVVIVKRTGLFRTED